MLVSPKWQTMWLESQHCSKNIMNVPLPSQQSKKVWEDLRSNCCSPNKLVQLEALKCWGMWINSQTSDDLKLKTVCFTAVGPLITKKMQPLHKDVDICKLKLSLMWALLVKVENIMHLEGPQYILEVFLQSCLSWLSSASGDGCENEVSTLIFQLLLSILKHNEAVSDCDGELFTPLSTDILHFKKIFHCHADKFLNIFINWRKVPDKKLFLKLWKCFLEHCELSCEHIPIPMWYKVFKLADQISSEKNDPVKERLAFLHSCATTLKSVLSSSKFIDFGNLLTTPCEALFKKLVELCTVKCTGGCDLEMFLYSKEICETLSDKSVAIGGFDFCIRVLDVLEEFWLKDLLWGVWCGLVYCYKVHLQHLDKKQFVELEMVFYRKLRGVAVNFELDRDVIHKDCISEVERHIEILNITCFCSSLRKCVPPGSTTGRELVALTPVPVPVAETRGPFGKFSTLALTRRTKVLPTTTDTFKLDLIRHILKNIDPDCFLGSLVTLRLNGLHHPPVSYSLQFKTNRKEDVTLTVCCLPPSLPVKKNAVVPYERKQKTKEEEEEEEEEVVSTPKTRSRKRAEDEMKREMDRQKRRKRKSFELIVQEIVRKNKERKTEKNSRRKSPVLLKGRRNKREVKESRQTKEEVKEEVKKRKKSVTDGKLENYFQVIKKSGAEIKKDEKKPRKGRKDGKKENTCCNTDKEDGERKGEIGWRQTSLKTMMNKKNKPEARTRSKNADVSDDRKNKKGSKVTGSPLSKLSPFKEVFHDHEYAKIEPQQLQTFERVILLRQGGLPCVGEQQKAEVTPEVSTEPPKMTQEVVNDKPITANLPSATTDSTTERLEVSKPEAQPPEAEKPTENTTDVDLEPTNTANTSEVQPQLDVTPKRGRKRVRMLDSLKPSKKMKLDEEENQEEKLPLEKEEKENLEEKQTKTASPVKKDKGKNEGCGMISSRALRMIALVPESTKGSQMQWESTPRQEVLKCKKAPNVDKNSRASKMLALLSENVVEVEEGEDVKAEESCKGLTSTPSVKTPVSSMKSPKSVKKRRSIRFDDAKNETVLYQTDTPPSQILEEKEKRRRCQPVES